MFANTPEALLFKAIELGDLAQALLYLAEKYGHSRVSQYLRGLNSAVSEGHQANPPLEIVQAQMIRENRSPKVPAMLALLPVAATDTSKKMRFSII